MNRIVRKEPLNSGVCLLEIEAPYIARKAKAGQFVILRATADSERIPLTINNYDPAAGTICIVYQVVGASTMQLNTLGQGDCIQDLVGPLGKPTETTGLGKVAVVGGGVGCAIAYPVAKQLHEEGCIVHTIVGFRTQELAILTQEMQAVSDKYVMMTDDGSSGTKGLVTDALKQLIESGEQYDRVFAIGPPIMMKFVCLTTKPYNIPTTVSMNPIMIDGTGMCGCCRLTVGGQTKFACVDGPDFDGHQVDFDEVIARNRRFGDYERERRDESCNLLNKKEGQ